jgi:hypothetical protein
VVKTNRVDFLQGRYHYCTLHAEENGNLPMRHGPTPLTTTALSSSAETPSDQERGSRSFQPQ